jgi:TPR repeat protein
MELGWLYQDGTYLGKDEVAAMRYFLLAAEQDDPDGEAAVVVAYETGTGVPVDHAQALSWYQKLVAHPSVVFDGESASAEIRAFYDAAGSHEGVQKWLLLCADAGELNCQSDAGFAYLEAGPEVDHQDYVKAVKFLNLAYRNPARGKQPERAMPFPYIDTLSAKIEVALGRLYASGGGVPQDYDAAMAWFKLADDAEANFEIGKLYLFGRGVAASDQDANAWFEKAAEKGLGLARLQLADMLLDVKPRSVDQVDAALCQLYRARSTANIEVHARINALLAPRYGIDDDAKLLNASRKLAASGDAVAKERLAYGYLQRGSLETIWGRPQQQEVGLAIILNLLVDSSPSRHRRFDTLLSEGPYNDAVVKAAARLAKELATTPDFLSVIDRASQSER